jgi:hypothetical protein
MLSARALLRDEDIVLRAGGATGLTEANRRSVFEGHKRQKIVAAKRCIPAVDKEHKTWQLGKKSSVLI